MDKPNRISASDKIPLKLNWLWKNFIILFDNAKNKNNMIINLTSKLNKILIDNRFMAQRLGWEASQL